MGSLVYAMGMETEHILKLFAFERESDTGNYNAGLTKFEEHFIP